jgi:hypothetical protein
MITILPARNSLIASGIDRVQLTESFTASCPFSMAEKMDAKQVEGMLMGAECRLFLKNAS